MYYILNASLLLVVAWVQLISAAAAFDENFPPSDAEWITLSETESFQPAPTNDNPRLRHAQRDLVQYSSKLADGLKYYDEYSQAWRMLGMFIDCNAEKDDHRRQLDEANVESGGSCQRYLLWAAYVDLDYQGGGIGEYQFHDPDKDTWDTSACEQTKSSRCAKMDCHLPDTHFTLLGFFKQQDAGDFMEQLFKHQAYCLWDGDQYEFMNGMREFWPNGCTSTGKYDGSSLIYMDIKPETEGKFGLGLYKDSSCTIEYTRNRVKLDKIVSTGSGNNIYDDIDTFNAGLSVFSVCQPCKAYSLSRNGDDHDEDGPFACQDDAGYNSVNQCMKFQTKTDMEAASYREVTLASQQGSINNSYAADVTQPFLAKWGGLIVSMLVFAAGLAAFIWSARPPKVVRPKKRKIAVSTVPLMD